MTALFSTASVPIATLRPAPVTTGLPPRIDAVCLDIDDTLIDYTASARAALREVVGRDDLWDTWQQLTEEHVARVVSGELDYETMRCLRTKAFFTGIGSAMDDAHVAELEARRLAAMCRTWQLFDDAVPCLDWLRAAGLKVAAVTNASGPHQRTKLADVGLARFFDTVVIAGEIGAAKPDPVIFHTACDQLGVQPEHALHIGDRLDLDAHGARDAGLHGVWLDREGSAQRRHEGGVGIISGLDDLAELLVSEYVTPMIETASAMPLQRM